jgi:hypothetical protein
MFVIDTFLGWVLNTIATAVDAEMNDDTALREQLLEAEMRREMGEISDDEFAQIEADLLQRIREIKERREGGSGPIGFGGRPLDATKDALQVEASVSGDFHEPADSGERIVPLEAIPRTRRSTTRRTARRGSSRKS